MTSLRPTSFRRSTFGTLIAAVMVMASFWLPGAVASASPTGGGSVAGSNGGALSGGNGGCFFAGCGTGTVAGGGGGASSIQLCSNASPSCVADYYTGSEPRLVVAGGGGGAGSYDGCAAGSGGGGLGPGSTEVGCNGGGGGGAGTGGSGAQLNCPDGNTGGAGATPTAAGAGGVGVGGQENGTDGAGPIGGDGYTTEASNGGGGGGGGGYYGGGGGGATEGCGAYGDGGGAGSSFSVAAMTVTNDTSASPSISLSYGSGPTIQSYTPGPEQSFVVPNGVTSINIVATGGTGGNNAENDGFGGYGAVVTTTIPATAGQTLYIDVASNGSNQFQVPAPVMSGVSGTATFGSTATLSATLQDNGVGLGGETVSFTLDSTPVGTAVTDSNGVATLSGVPTSDGIGDDTNGVTASFAGAGTYTPASGTGDLVVGQASQAVTFTSDAPSAPALGDTYTPIATGGGSGNPVVFSIDPATSNSACSISGGTVTFDHAGTCVIDADQAGDADYTAAPTAQQQVTVGQESQAVTFTSIAPSAPALGDTYTPIATGGGSGNPVVFSIDPATSNSACSISGGTVTFDHAGTCVIDADQAGDADYTAAPTAQQQVTVGQESQAVTFTSIAPSAPALGDTYTPIATGGGSGNPVVFSIDPATTNGACSISGDTVTFDHTGTCVIDADQTGNADYTAAPTAQQQVSVGKVAQAVNFTSTAPTAPALGDTYTPIATGGGSGNPVVFSIDPATTNSACSISGGTVTFDHAGTCVIDADQAGSSDYDAAPTAQQQVSVGKVATMTALTIGPSSLSVSVTAPSLPSSTVSGAVDFTVNGHDIGSATLSGGSATLTHTLAPGHSYDVVASYQGDNDFANSSGSARRTDPTIHAAVHSARARTSYGWYSTPVTVSFTCTAGSAALSSPCPTPVTLSTSAARQHLSRTISTVDGGAATATVTGINIDRTAPSVAVSGVKNGGVYRGAARRVRCVGHDAQSGVVRCTLRTTVERDGLTRYVATATNRAGLKASTHGSYRAMSIWIPRVRFTHAGGFQLKVGTYNLYAASSSRPYYEWAAPVNTSHPAGGNAGFTAAGAGIWRMTIHITPSMTRRYTVWDLGVKLHGHLQLVRVTLH